MREKRSRDMFKSVQTIKIDEKKKNLGLRFVVKDHNAEQLINVKIANNIQIS